MFSIIIPLFNEEKNIVNLLEEISKNLNKYDRYEIILINDYSTDNTIKVLKKINNDKILIISNLKNKGQSFSIYHGVKNSKYNVIVTLDGDGQNDPKDVPKLLDVYLSNHEIKLVGGVRSKRQDNFIKIISSKIANFVRSKILQDNCNDTGCALKVFDKNIFLNFTYFDGIHRFLPALFNGYGHKSIFINVNHRKRKHGYSKYGTFLRLFRGIRDMIKVLKIIKAQKNI